MRRRDFRVSSLLYWQRAREKINDVFDNSIYRSSLASPVSLAVRPPNPEEIHGDCSRKRTIRVHPCVKTSEWRWEREKVWRLSFSFFPFPFGFQQSMNSEDPVSLLFGQLSLSSTLQLWHATNRLKADAFWLSSEDLSLFLFTFFHVRSNSNRALGENLWVSCILMRDNETAQNFRRR